MKINVPNEIIEVINKLNTVENTTSLIVGGAVRDAFMGLEPKDWDIVSNVPIDIIENMFDTYDIGNNKTFNVVVIKTQIGAVEIANFRDR